MAEVTLKAPGIRSVTTVTPDSSVVTLTEESSEAEVEDMSLPSYWHLPLKPCVDGLSALLRFPRAFTSDWQAESGTRSPLVLHETLDALHLVHTLVH
jgi:hypothetical protein